MEDLKSKKRFDSSISRKLKSTYYTPKINIIPLLFRLFVITNPIFMSRKYLLINTGNTQKKFIKGPCSILTLFAMLLEHIHKRFAFHVIPVIANALERDPHKHIETHKHRICLYNCLDYEGFEKQESFDKFQLSVLI